MDYHLKVNLWNQRLVGHMQRQLKKIKEWSGVRLMLRTRVTKQGCVKGDKEWGWWEEMIRGWSAQGKVSCSNPYCRAITFILPEGGTVSKNTYYVQTHSLDRTDLTDKTSVPHLGQQIGRKSTSCQNEYCSLRYSYFHHYKLLCGNHDMSNIMMII